MKIVIAGLGKSGTTALYFKIRQAMPADTVGLFEPKRFDAEASGHATNVVAKIIISHRDRPDYASFRDFQKKISLARDPRDNIISRILYQVFNRLDFCRDETRVARYLEILKRKEDNPRSVSVLSIVATLSAVLNVNHLDAILVNSALMEEFERDEPDYFSFQYEQLVAGELSALETYLGFALERGAAQVSDDLARVTRTKGTGDWRNWMTAEDVAFFRPRLASFMAKHGYPDDWTLSASPKILPEHCTQYVRRIIEERKRAG